VLVDTNVVSELMRARPSAVVLRWADAQQRLELSVVTVEEVRFGLALRPSARMERAFDALVDGFCEVLPVTRTVAERCATLRSHRRLAGRPTTQADLLIAATAAEHGLVLVTRNTRDFDGCGIRVLDPWSSRRT